MGMSSKRKIRCLITRLFLYHLPVQDFPVCRPDIQLIISGFSQVQQGLQ